MEQTGSCRRGDMSGEWWEDGEGTSQRTCMNGPWTWAMVCGLTVEQGWAGWRKAGEEIWDNHNRITVKEKKRV